MTIPSATGTDMDTMGLILRDIYNFGCRLAKGLDTCSLTQQQWVLVKVNMGKMLTAVSTEIVNSMYS
jgi:hypothetical protein